MDFRPLLLSFVALCGSLACAQIRVEAAGRTPTQVSDAMDVQARQFSRSVARLTVGARYARLRTARHRAQFPFSLPMRVTVLHPAVSSPQPRAAAGLTLAFDTTGTRIFPSAYQALLQSVFSTAQPTLNAVFGMPASGGVVHVRNYDADIGDRDAVAGGYYTPNNGKGEAEIRFPVYSSNEAAAVNFVHTLLLAYQGSKPYTYDAFNEGIVRAAVIKIARTPGALPASLASDVIESVLENSYDVGATYDWNNQRPLGGPFFIASNLRSNPLPTGGSVGGLYLLRYLMSGSAWLKVLTEYPAFIASYNQAYYANTSISANPGALVTLAQSVLNGLAGGSATVEGRSFAEWFKRQFILETSQSFGTKVLCEPIPVTSGLSGSDFGVFIIQANFFSTALNGDETLLSGTSYPIFWDNNFNRVTPSVQDQQMIISGAYGSVTPNFSDFFGGQPYRVTVDLSVVDQLARVNIPAGAIATAANPNGNTIFGTVEGAPLTTGSTLTVNITYPGGSLVTTPVVNGAFGQNITDPAYLRATTVTLSVVKKQGTNSSTLLTRVVDKTVGSLGVDLVVNGEVTYTASLPGGLSLLGFPVDPFSSSAPAIFSSSPSLLQQARFNPTKVAYDQYPSVEPPVVGHSYYVRLPAAQPTFNVPGRSYANYPVSVALQPGWNMISNPLNATVPFSSVQVVHASDNPTTYANSTGVTIGTDAFGFVPGSIDAASGLVETGSLNAVTTFAPGQGFLVRVLAPEGVTLTFFPSSPAIGPYLRAAAPTHGWGVRLELSDGTRTLPLHLGTVKEAKSDVDWRYCSQLAPSVGGLQAVANRGMRFFRDIRKDTGAQQRYLVRLEGLTVGRNYTVKFPVERGLIRLMQLVDGGVVRTIGPSTVWTFKATSVSRDIELRMTGVAL